MTITTPALDMRDVSKRFSLRRYRITDLYRFARRRITVGSPARRHRANTALDGVSLTVERGENVGIIGRNGAGKTTLLQIMSGVMWPSSGAVDRSGTVAALLDLGSGLHPDFTGRENVLFYCSLLGFTRREAQALIPEIVDFSELVDCFDDPFRTYSAGMKARLGFSVSMAVKPDTLIIDEVLAVGDEAFRRKCYEAMDRFFKRERTVVFVSHNLEEVLAHCSRVIWLDRGRVRYDGPTVEGIEQYREFLSSE